MHAILRGCRRQPLQRHSYVVYLPLRASRTVRGKRLAQEEKSGAKGKECARQSKTETRTCVHTTGIYSQSVASHADHNTSHMAAAL